MCLVKITTRIKTNIAFSLRVQNNISQALFPKPQKTTKLELWIKVFLLQQCVNITHIIINLPCTKKKHPVACTGNANQAATEKNQYSNDL